MPSQRKAEELTITLLAQGVSVAETARSAGISERTMYRRLQDPAFVAKVEEARAKVAGIIQGRVMAQMAVIGEGALELVFLGLEAARELRALPQKPAPSMAWVVAQKEILSQGAKAIRLLLERNEKQGGGDGRGGAPWGSSANFYLQGDSTKILPKPDWGTEGCPYPKEQRTRIANIWERIEAVVRKEHHASPASDPDPDQDKEN